MYSVFLVEDEIVTRDGIRNSIAWDDTDYAFVGEALDGEMALHALREIKPDILITDIKMPFMDGLTLARLIKKDQPWIKIIILSGHDEFEYAQEAISIGVEEYLLKPVSSAVMLSTLDKVAVRIEEEKRHLTSIEDLKEKIRSTEEVLREKWFYQLVTGQIDTANAIDSARGMGIDLLPGGYAVMLVELACPDDSYTRCVISKKVVSSILAERDDIFCFSMGIEKQALLVKKLDNGSGSDVLYALAQGVKFDVERNTECSVAIGIGSVVSHIGEIVNSYSEADRAVKYMRLTGKKLIIGSGDMKWGQIMEQFQSENDHLTSLLKFVETDELEKLAEQYHGAMNDNQAGDPGPGFYKFLFRDIIKTLSALIEELHGSDREIIPEAFQPDIMEAACKSRDQFTSVLTTIMKKWISFRDANVHKKHNTKIMKAKTYIRENFKSQDISLNSVASYVNVSPNHFSTIFSQEVGETFIEYLTSVRIEHARDLLLNSMMKCSEITFEVGYSDPHYFSFIFKKNTGLSPSEFRAENSVPVE